jgi:hypothetical protein
MSWVVLGWMSLPLLVCACFLHVGVAAFVLPEGLVLAAIPILPVGLGTIAFRTGAQGLARVILVLPIFLVCAIGWLMVFVALLRLTTR